MAGVDASMAVMDGWRTRFEIAPIPT